MIRKETYNMNGVSSANSEYISTRDHTRAYTFDSRLYIVHHFKPSSGSKVRSCTLFTGEGGCIIKKDRTVTSLIENDMLVSIVNKS
ncbi:hypothetical protein HanIR_Chr08g0362011 [Helianthus annuus]|nr:hypothetical protein HanIR_Chr08g0362011 [Helianthus annuus]